MKRFENAVGLVTGGASGIGAAICRRLVSEGGRVVIADVNRDLASALVDELGAGSAIFAACDVTRPEDIEAAVASAESTFGGLDILFNNAGLAHQPARAPEISIEDWRRVMAVDIDGVFFGCRAAVPALRRRGGGSIVNMASLSGLAGDHGLGAYNAAKGALVNYTRTLAVDHACDDIRVNALCPGLVETPLTAGLFQAGVPEAMLNWIPMRRAATPDEIAGIALFLASSDASYMTGSIVSADGGVLAYSGQPDFGTLLRSASS